LRGQGCSSHIDCASLRTGHVITCSAICSATYGGSTPNTSYSSFVSGFCLYPRYVCVPPSPSCSSTLCISCSPIDLSLYSKFKLVSVDELLYRGVGSCLCHGVCQVVAPINPPNILKLASLVGCSQGHDVCRMRAEMKEKVDCSTKETSKIIYM
jgi:hypothetical protein